MSFTVQSTDLHPTTAALGAQAFNRIEQLPF